MEYLRTCADIIGLLLIPQLKIYTMDLRNEAFRNSINVDLLSDVLNHTVELAEGFKSWKIVEDLIKDLIDLSQEA